MWLTQEKSHDAARAYEAGPRRGKVRVAGMRKPFFAVNCCLTAAAAAVIVVVIVIKYYYIVVVHFHSAAKSNTFALL